LYRTGILLASCASFLIWRRQAVSQLAFYGAPAPSDVAANIDGDDAGPGAVFGVFSRKPFEMTFADPTKVRLLRNGHASLINIKEVRKDPSKDPRLKPGARSKCAAELLVSSLSVVR